MNVALALYLIGAMAYFLWMSREITNEKLEDLLEDCPDHVLGWGVFVLAVLYGAIAMLWLPMLIVRGYVLLRDQFGGEGVEN